MGRCLFVTSFCVISFVCFFWSARARGDRLEESDDDGRWKTCNEFAPISQARSLARDQREIIEGEIRRTVRNLIKQHKQTRDKQNINEERVTTDSYIDGCLKLKTAAA